MIFACLDIDFQGPLPTQELFDQQDFISTSPGVPTNIGSYHILKIMRQKCQTEFCGGHRRFLAAILDWQWGIFNPAFYAWYRSFVPILVILLSIFNRGDNLKEKQAYKKIWALPVKIFILNFCLWPVYLCAKRISFLSPFLFA